MNRFEQLIEYVINDEEQKARELFHDIVVEKSRQIYENLMQEEADADLDEAKEEDLDEAKEEDLEEGMGGDASDELIDEIEADEETDMSMEAEGDDGDDMGGDEGGDDMGGDDMGGDDMGGDSEPATKGDIMDLEDKLDQLMAEFEDLMAGDDMGGDGDDFGSDEGGDAIEMDDTEEMMPEMGTMPMAEAVTLKAAPKPVTSEEGGVNKKSTVAANAGGKGPIGNTVKPVHAGGEMGGHHDSAAYRNTTKDLIGKVGNTPAQGTQKPSPATKPKLGQESGVNNKSVVPGR
jgi:hypothetical protein